MRKLVVLIAGVGSFSESVEYEKLATMDSVSRDESPLSLRTIYSKMRDRIDSQTMFHMTLDWVECATAVVVYDELEITAFDERILDEARDMGIDIEFRVAPDWSVKKLDVKDGGPSPSYPPAVPPSLAVVHVQNLSTLYHAAKLLNYNSIPTNYMRVSKTTTRPAILFANPGSPDKWELYIDSYLYYTGGQWKVLKAATFESIYGTTLRGYKTPLTYRV